MRAILNAFLVGASIFVGTEACLALEGQTQDAYVQSVDHESDDDGTTKFIVTIKIKRSGTYYVAAGFTKNDKLHRGLITKNKFYGVKAVQGEAGDQLRVTIRHVQSPPFNRKYTAGVFESEDDIETSG